jgi:type VI secretion system secreted protein Hcp
MYDSYLQIDGVKGEALDDKHKDWIELAGFGHQIIQPVSQTQSSAGGAATGRTQHGDFLVHKYVDLSSPKLYEAVSNGKHFSKAKIEVCRAGGSQTKFLEITLEEVMISKVQLDSPHNGNVHVAGFQAPGTTTADSHSKTDLPTESVHLNYGKIEWTYTQQKRKDGSGGGNVSAKYDLTAGKS